MASKLTVRNRKFVQENSVSGDMGDAYVKAGYSAPTKKTATANAHKLLKKPHIKAYYDKLMSKMESESIAPATEVLEFLTSMMRGEIKEERIVVVEGDINRVWVQANAKERVRVAEDLAKRHRLFSEKVEVKVEDLFEGAKTMAELINNPEKNRTLEEVEKG